jgi:hypothetical protein
MIALKSIPEAEIDVGDVIIPVEHGLLTEHNHFSELRYGFICTIFASDGLIASVRGQLFCGGVVRFLFLVLAKRTAEPCGVDLSVSDVGAFTIHIMRGARPPIESKDQKITRSLPCTPFLRFPYPAFALLFRRSIRNLWGCRHECTRRRESNPFVLCALLCRLLMHGPTLSLVSCQIFF